MKSLEYVEDYVNEIFNEACSRLDELDNFGAVRLFSFSEEFYRILEKPEMEKLCRRFVESIDADDEMKKQYLNSGRAMAKILISFMGDLQYYG